ncbi:MAG: hypothetical protein OEZ57_08415 [Nitrospirota bacterium]|nr:hypothetical protein [Nitrospirota bacterium]MDH5585633.1 hypothetical protein [Nitrospirota bacterium]MDH5774925.1 hypothetical protein [Nitrospirota bacterium]
MHVAPLKKILNLCLVSTLFFPLLPAQATESPAPLTVTLEKTIQFPDLEGENVLVPAGDYSVKAGEDQLTLTGSNSQAITIDANEGSHGTEIPAPDMVLLSSDDDATTQAHLLAVYYPDGKTLEALGRDPEITSRGTMEPTAEDLEFIDPSLVTFDKPVHFFSPEGNPTLVQPGTYTAESSPSGIRLIPDQNQPPLLIEAKHETQDTGIPDLLALSLPGETPEELDVHYLMVLLPTGDSLEAVGSYSGIQDRGFWDKKRKSKRAKKRASIFNKVGAKFTKATKSPAFKKVAQVTEQGTKAVGGGINKGVSASKWAVGQAGKGVTHAANWTAKQAKFVGQQILKGKDIVVCRAAVGAIKGVNAVGKAAGKLAKFNPLAPIMGKVSGMGSKFTDKIKKDLKLQQQMEKEIQNHLKLDGQALVEVNRIVKTMSTPQNLKKYFALFSAKQLCERSASDTVSKLVKLHGGERLSNTNSPIRTRGTGHFYMTYGFAVALEGKMAGLQLGIMIITDYKNDHDVYSFIGPQVGYMDVGAETLFQIGFYPKLNASTDLKDWGLAYGVGANPSILWKAAAAPATGGASMAVGVDYSVALDFVFNPADKHKFLGFVVSPGGVSIAVPGGAGDIQAAATYAGSMIHE